MFIVLLRFSSGKSGARELMAAHNEWVERGLGAGVFLLTGSIQPGLGGALLAHDTTRAELDERIQMDPFVAHDVVTAEVLEILPSRADPRVAFLCG